MENNFNYTIATMEEVTNALGTVIAIWDLNSTKTDKTREIEGLLHEPESVVILENWKENIQNESEINFEKLIIKCNEVKDYILVVLYQELGNYVGEKSHLFLPYMTRRQKNLVRFGWLLSQSIDCFWIGWAVITDGCNDDGLSTLEDGLNEIKKHHNFQTGELIDININNHSLFVNEEQAAEYIIENGLNKSEVAPLTREMFMLNTEVFITPSYFRMVQDDYQESSLLPYSFCKKWLEEELINEVEMDGKIVRYPFEDERLTWNQEEVSSLDMLERLAVELDKMEVQRNEAYELILKMKLLTKIA